MEMKKIKTVEGQHFVLWGNAAYGRGVYCQQGDTAKKLQELERNIHRCFHHRTLYNYLKKLKDSSNIFVSQIHSKQSNKQYCKMNAYGAQVYYFLMDGFTFITDLVLVDTQYEQDLKNMSAAGVYRIRKTDQIWQPHAPANKVLTLHASINGEVEELEEVMQFIPAMIKKAYQNAEIEITGKGAYNGFTHIYMPGKKSKKYGWKDMMPLTLTHASKGSKAVKQSLVDRTASCIEIAAQAKKQVKWTIQGSGSEIFVDAVEKVIKENPQLSLNRQQAHFFNAHTDPMRIKKVVERAGAVQDYTSALRSKENIAAMAKGHRKYMHEKIAETKQEKPGSSQLGNQQDAIKMEDMALGAKGMTVKIAGYSTALAGAIANPAVVSNAITSGLDAYALGLHNAPALTIGGTMAAAATLYQSVKMKAPKMLALGHLGIAAVTGDRRLDQITEIDTFKAYDQLKSLKLGYAI